MSELLELTVAEAAERRSRRASSRADEYFDAWREAAAGDELNAYLWRGRGRRRRRRRGRAPLRRHPGRGQGHLLHRGGADHRRLAHPRGLPAALHLDRGAAAARGRRAGARQDQHGRVRDGLLERELRLRAGAQPLGPRAGPGRLLGRLGGRRSPAASRPARSAPTPAARSASPPRSAGSSASSPPTARSRATG